MDRPVMVFQKKADNTTNKMIIPKAVLEQWGRYFLMEVYSDHIKLIPTKKEK